MDRRALERSLEYVDSWLRWRCPRADVPGCVVAVSQRGRVLMAEAYGHADVASGRKLKAAAVYRIASHSKSFAATVVLQLVEQGRVRLDDRVVDHLGWLAQHHDRRFRHVTLRQLMSHGAGVIRDGNDADFWQLRRPFPDADQLRAEILEAELVTDPNVAHKYSNFGFGLLGLLLEEVSGRTFFELAEEQIVEPLGLRATMAELRPPLTARAVTGYIRREPGRDRRAVPPDIDTGALAAATGFASTATDLCTYFSALFVGSNKLLHDESKREMQRVHWHVHRPASGGEQDYGLGLMLATVGGHPTFGHSGGFPGQATRTYADPSRGLVVTALTSCSDGPSQDIGRGILGIIEYFQTRSGAIRRGLGRLEGRFVNFGSARDVIVAGSDVCAATPDTWDPLGDPDRLDVVDSTTLRIADTSSYDSPGEFVRYTLHEREVDTVRWAGMTMWPEKRWPQVERTFGAPRRRRRAGTGGAG